MRKHLRALRSLRLHSVLSVLGGLLILGGVLYGVLHWPAAEPWPGIGAFVALGGLLLTQAKNMAEQEEKRSKFHLDACAEAYELAASLLEDGNNDRRIWLEAARALEHAKALALGVTVKGHLRVLELKQMSMRGAFDNCLRKPAAFFYGVDPSMALDAAGEQATAPVEEGGRHIVSTLHELDEASIRAVWEAAQWPSQHTDTLRHFSDIERDKLFVLYPGLHETFSHRERYASAAGKLHERSHAELERWRKKRRS